MSASGSGRVRKRKNVAGHRSDPGWKHSIEVDVASKKTGCTIMSDGWSDRKRRSICNFLVNRPNGTIFLSSLDTSDISKAGEKVFEMLDEIVEKVGIEHVVQVVTDNASNYKLVGEMLMDKRKSLFWTLYAAHCIDLMLEEDRKRRSICNFLVNRPNGTIFLSSLDTSDISKAGEKVFEMLDEIVEKVGIEHVVQVVTDNASNYKLAGEMLMDKRKSLFWTLCAAHCIDLMLEDFDKQIQLHRAAVPLIKVLRLVDSDEHLAMGFIYEAMDRAKVEIQSNFNNVFTYYDPIWTIIDRRWESQLHHPLHAAANARHGCDSDEDEVEALARNLEEACCDHIGREHDEVHEVSDNDAMDQNMDARRDFDHDFEDATISEDIEDLDGTGGGDDDDDDDVAMINVDCAIMMIISATMMTYCSFYLFFLDLVCFVFIKKQ
ncbi:uncharacterized protein LOC114288921 [Camellia sinensis]|uniref:uncharacterized protein LOC114288921 n=1 Tax=Camellia sinensis TaxID=4442 RepID=UPI0010360082|nr:uncharacterized protein LOC114288921 [Camellia sinensis]